MTIEDLYTKLQTIHNLRVTSIKEVFEDYYKEENVDICTEEEPKNLKSSFIAYVNNNYDLETDKHSEIIKSFIDYYSREAQAYKSNVVVYFKEATVTASDDRTHTIYDTYVRIPFSYFGFFRYMELARTSYTSAELASRYKHSHASLKTSISYSTCCLGNSYLKDLYITLQSTFSIHNLMLLCKAVDDYIHVESTYTSPYSRLSTISSKNVDKRFEYFNPLLPKYYNPEYKIIHKENVISNTILREFIKYIIKEKGSLLKIRLVGNSRIICNNFNLLYMDMSSWFKDFYNSLDGVTSTTYEALLESDFLVKVLAFKDVLYNPKEAQHLESMINWDMTKPILTFKGEPKYLKIIQFQDDEHKPRLMVVLSLYAYNKILTILNLMLTYGNTADPYYI